MIGDRWGVTDDEIKRPYPCDGFVSTPVLQAWRGVTVRAAPDDVWPWIKQIRLAPYSYDCIDNLGHRSPQQLCPLPEPAPAEHFTTTGRFRLGRILTADPKQQLTAEIMGAVMSYALVPHDGSTRLLLKVVVARNRRGDLIMARRQLLNLKRLAEG